MKERSRRRGSPFHTDPLRILADVETPTLNYVHRYSNDRLDSMLDHLTQLAIGTWHEARGGNGQTRLGMWSSCSPMALWRVSRTCGPVEEHCGEWPLNLWESSVRVPLIISQPGRIPGGRVLDELASACDLHPTLLELAGVAAPTDPLTAGRSMAGLLLDVAGKDRGAVNGLRRVRRDPHGA